MGKSNYGSNNNQKSVPVSLPDPGLFDLSTGTPPTHIPAPTPPQQAKNNKNKKRSYRPSPYQKTPQPNHCPQCGHTIFTVLADNVIEQDIDPINLTTQAITACQLLHIPLFRGPQIADGPPILYWYRDNNDKIKEGEYVSPKHQCGHPPLPGNPIPTRYTPTTTSDHNDQPPY